MFENDALKIQKKIVSMTLFVPILKGTSIPLIREEHIPPQFSWGFVSQMTHKIRRFGRILMILGIIFDLSNILLHFTMLRIIFSQKRKVVSIGKSF